MIHVLDAAPPGPRDVHELWRAWPLEPGVMAALLLLALAYARGMRRAAGAAPARGDHRTLWFVLGWITLALALASPLHPWGEVLFSAHMTQHELLMLIAAPLLVLGRAEVALLRALPVRWARRLAGGTAGTPRRIGAAMTHPLVAWAIHAVVLWSWHAPGLFQAAIEHESVHALQHVSFLGSAVLFWWAVLHAGPRHALGYGAAVMYLFTTALHSGLLGALLTFAGAAWYPAYRGAWGMTALEDQQLGGLIMWVPACSLYTVAALVLFAGWLRSSGELARARESRDAVAAGHAIREGT